MPTNRCKEHRSKRQPGALSRLRTAGLISVAGLLVLQACGTTEADRASMQDRDGSKSYATPRQVPKHAQTAGRFYSQVGVASWYGGKFHGRRTASGEIFDMNRLTAAHPSLPFGTKVTVTNLRNGRAVTVRINDRGPFIKGRIIDVSRQAAQRLGFIGDGITDVGIRVHRRGG